MTLHGNLPFSINGSLRQSFVAALLTRQSFVATLLTRKERNSDCCASAPIASPRLAFRPMGSPRKNGWLIAIRFVVCAGICRFPQAGILRQSFVATLLTRTALSFSPDGVTTKKRMAYCHPLRGDPFEVKGELFSSAKLTVLLCPL